MALNTIAAGVGILLLVAGWYGLQVGALRDLRARPSVRGDNKLLWAFAILCVPYAGALGYLTFGPTSFLPRPDRHDRTRRPVQTRRVVSTARLARPTQVAPRPAVDLLEPAVPTLRLVDRDPVPRSPSMSPGRPHRQLIVDPVVGTDSADLLPARVSTPRSRRPVPEAIRWPGSTIPQSYQQAEADLHD